MADTKTDIVADLGDLIGSVNELTESVEALGTTLGAIADSLERHEQVLMAIRDALNSVAR